MLRTILPDVLHEILKKHLAWLEDEPDGEKANLSSANLSSANLSFANLRSATLSSADLSSADLSFADLRSANLSSADLRSANLDFSSGFSFRCTSFGAKIDIRLGAQLAYHFCKMDSEDPDVKAAQQTMKDLANKSHLVEECGRIE